LTRIKRCPSDDSITLGALGTSSATERYSFDREAGFMFEIPGERVALGKRVSGADRELECGHRWGGDKEAPQECPFCAENRETYYLAAMAFIRDEQEKAVG